MAINHDLAAEAEDKQDHCCNFNAEGWSFWMVPIRQGLAATSNVNFPGRKKKNRIAAGSCTRDTATEGLDKMVSRWSLAALVLGGIHSRSIHAGTKSQYFRRTWYHLCYISIGIVKVKLK